MISTPELHSNSSIDDDVVIPIGREECCRQVADAERELSAFLSAVQALYGDSAVKHAADDWIALAENIQLPSIQVFPNWRYVTILASSQLAIDHFGFRPKEERNDTE